MYIYHTIMHVLRASYGVLGFAAGALTVGSHKFVCKMQMAFVDVKLVFIASELIDTYKYELARSLYARDQVSFIIHRSLGRTQESIGFVVRVQTCEEV